MPCSETLWPSFLKRLYSEQFQKLNFVTASLIEPDKTFVTRAESQK